jgi:glycosyltransferase involved in cell wall biosynthesis
MHKKIKIGLVLAATPAYSETFFNAKIKGLQEAEYELVLFVNKKAHSHLKVAIKQAPQLSENKFKSFIISIFCLIKLFFFSYTNAKKMYYLDQRDGLHFKKRIQNLILNSHILSEKLDWLHFGFGTLALNRENVAAAIGANMAVSFRGFDHYVYPLKHPDCYKLLFSKKVKYHVLSESMKKDLISNGIKETEIVKITPAIDLTVFKKENINKEEKIEIITIARLHWIKGLDYTLQALALVKEQGVNFKYTIIGEGIEKERLQFAVHQLGLKENVFFLGKLASLQVKEEMEKSTYYIQYSLQEGFCNAVLEAQAMGLLCLVSDAEGLSENVLNGETGFVVPKRNPEVLAAKIIEVIAISEFDKEKITNQAKHRIKTNFTIENQIKEFIAFYQ